MRCQGQGLLLRVCSNNRSMKITCNALLGLENDINKMVLEIHTAYKYTRKRFSINPNTKAQLKTISASSHLPLNCWRVQKMDPPRGHIVSGIRYIVILKQQNHLAPNWKTGNFQLVAIKPREKFRRKRNRFMHVN
jgi:hypothetical protein